MKRLLRNIDGPTVAIVVGIALLLFIGIDATVRTNTPMNGTVIDKHYEPSHSSTGTGYVTTGNGSGGVVVSSHHESEQFVMMVRTSTGQVVTVESSPETYYSTKTGDSVEFYEQRGVITGIVYRYEVN